MFMLKGGEWADQFYLCKKTHFCNRSTERVSTAILFLYFQRTLAILLATLVAAFVSSAAEELLPPAVKLDKNLRRALLKALTDLDTESAEQKGHEIGESSSVDSEQSAPSESTTVPQETKTREPVRTIFSFDGFPSDEESPSEDKLQNTTFVESDKLLAIDTSSSNTATTVEPTLNENNRIFQSHDVVLPDKSSAIYEKSPEIVNDQLETRSVKTSSSSSANDIDVSSKSSSSSVVESLDISPSNGIATANALVAPSPTPSSPTAAQNTTKSTSKNEKEEQEVNIFQAPLVAAFTVQQDERGVPKSVVPIYSPNGDGQALTLQEQLDFKQQLLERQLAELQAQQIQQTQFLMRQQQLYEQQLRQKQQQQLFIQEQARLKLIREAEQSRLKRLEEQRNYQLQQQKQAQQFSIGQNGLFPVQGPFKSPNVNVQPSFALELPKASQPPAFQTSFNDQLRIQQLQRQQQQQSHIQQQQQLQQARQHQLLQQQRLQQNFAGFPIDFQPPNSGPARFNRQEAFGAVGNFGFNDNRPQQQQHLQQQQLQQQSSNNRNHFGFSQHPSRVSQSFHYNPYQVQQLQQQQQQQQVYRTQRPQTPATQIQHLLFQSGVAGDLGTPQGTGGQEDLNIVSKVLALNVGAIPTKNFRYPGNNFGNVANNA